MAAGLPALSLVHRLMLRIDLILLLNSQHYNRSGPWKALLLCYFVSFVPDFLFCSSYTPQCVCCVFLDTCVSFAEYMVVVQRRASCSSHFLPGNQLGSFPASFIILTCGHVIVSNQLDNSGTNVCHYFQTWVLICPMHSSTCHFYFGQLDAFVAWDLESYTLKMME